MMKKTAVLIAVKFALLVGFTAGLTGCNTMQGLGKDVSKLGDKIEHKAEEKKKY